MTLYAFSVENWKRPRYEVATLMMLLKEYLRKELATLMDNNIRFTAIGRVEGLDPSVQRELEVRRGTDGARTAACSSRSRSTTAGAPRSSTPSTASWPCCASAR